MTGPLVLSIDQGTSSTKCLLVDAEGAVVARGQAPLGQTMPEPGWVEQDATAIWDSVRTAVADTVSAEYATKVATVGLSTQRESCVIWERQSGKPLTPVISWQDQRTEAICRQLHTRGVGKLVRRTSGLPLDPMFSAAKANWLLDRIDPDRARAKSGEICIGTIDAFLLSRFGGEAVVEAGNASRMQLVNVATAQYDSDLLDIFDIPAAALPRIVPSVGPFPRVRNLAPLPDGVPLRAVLADSHAALYAHSAFAPGPVKATHGTGSSVMGVLDTTLTPAAGLLECGLCLTIAWWTDVPVCAFEGNIRAAGSTLVWAAELLGIDTEELAALAAKTDDAGSVHLVPGFNGLGAPWWDNAAVATLSGFTFDTGRDRIARAALESIAQQIADLVDAVREGGVAVERLHVDGGPTRNDQLMQFEADIIGAPVVRTGTTELSALGAAYLAGISEGVFTADRIAGRAGDQRTFMPTMDKARRNRKRADWRRAVARSLSSFGAAVERPEEYQEAGRGLDPPDRKGRKKCHGAGLKLH